MSDSTSSELEPNNTPSTTPQAAEPDTQATERLAEMLRQAVKMMQMWLSFVTQSVEADKKSASQEPPVKITTIPGSTSASIAYKNETGDSQNMVVNFPNGIDNEWVGKSFQRMQAAWREAASQEKTRQQEGANTFIKETIALEGILRQSGATRDQINDVVACTVMQETRQILETERAKGLYEEQNPPTPIPTQAPSSNVAEPSQEAQKNTGQENQGQQNNSFRYAPKNPANDTGQPDQEPLVLENVAAGARLNYPGRQVIVTGDIGEGADLKAAHIEVRGNVSDNVRLVADAPNNSTLSIAGTVGSNVVLTGGAVTAETTIGNGVSVNAGKLTAKDIGDNANINAGKLTAESVGNNADINAGKAEISKSIGNNAEINAGKYELGTNVSPATMGTKNTINAGNAVLNTTGIEDATVNAGMLEVPNGNINGSTIDVGSVQTTAKISNSTVYFRQNAQIGTVNNSTVEQAPNGNVSGGNISSSGDVSIGNVVVNGNVTSVSGGVRSSNAPAGMVRIDTAINSQISVQQDNTPVAVHSLHNSSIVANGNIGVQQTEGDCVLTSNYGTATCKNPSESTQSYSNAVQTAQQYRAGGMGM